MYRATFEKDGFTITSKDERYSKMLLDLGYKPVDKKAKEETPEDTTFEVPEFDAITVDQIKTILKENGIEFGSKDSKTELYAKLLQIGTDKDDQ